VLTGAYSDHITELSSARPKQPFFFLKPPTSILLPGEGPVIQPKGVNLHYEVELALIIGKRLKDFEATDDATALDAVESMFFLISTGGHSLMWSQAML
jgi:acylpyruvate hydrolase